MTREETKEAIKVMQDYTNYCSSEQTRRAYRLGAPLEIFDPDNSNGVICDNKSYAIPTTQQMIGWLREKGFWIYVKRYWQYNRFYACFEKQGLERIECTDDFKKPEQAEFAVIDAALDYLEREVRDETRL